MTIHTATATQPEILTESQRKVVEMDMSLIGTWWKIMSSPRSFFVRAGVHAGNYGDELLFSSGQGPNAMNFFLVLLGVSALISALLSGSLSAGVGVIFTTLLGLFSTIFSFFLLSGVCLLFAKMLRCSGDYNAAKSLIAFSYAPVVIMSFGGMLFGIPAVFGLVYWLVLVYFGIRYTYRAQIFKALVFFVLLSTTMITLALLSMLIQGEL